MKETIKIFFKLLLLVIAFIYFSIVIVLSLFILKENDFGVTVINNKSYILVNETNKNKNTESGMLVVVESKDINKYVEDDELYVYESDKQNRVIVSSGFVESVENENEVYVTLKGRNASYREDIIIGVPVRKIPKLGGIIDFLKDRWIFLALIIVPSSLIVMYEIFYIFKTFVFDKRKLDIE